MPSRMKLRAAKLRTPSQCVVRFFAAIRLSNENTLGSDFTSQYRRSPGARGANVAAHAPPSFFTGLAAAFFAAFVAGVLFAAGLAGAFFFAGPVAVFAPVRLPFPDEPMACP